MGGGAVIYPPFSIRILMLLSVVVCGTVSVLNESRNEKAEWCISNQMTTAKSFDKSEDAKFLLKMQQKSTSRPADSHAFFFS